MSECPFSVELDVRDYELDMQGVVNNAVYLNYLEYARHQYLRSNGVDFADVTLAGIRLVVTRIEMDYIASLRSGDRFTVSATMERISRIRWGFRQEIARKSDGKIMLRALVIGTSLDERGRPYRCPVVERLLDASGGAPDRKMRPQSSRVLGGRSVTTPAD
jgi:acyl-CoA thioester hydrolase